MKPVPSLQLPQHKLDKLADDLKKLEVTSTMQVGSGTVPTFQRQGYLEKMGHQREKWFKRFFVLRDSFLLGYNLQKSDYTVEPRAAIHLGNATIEIPQEVDPAKPFCFAITTMQHDKFLLACENESDLNAWVEALEVAKKITHANMVKLAVENRCLAEEKGAAGVALDSTMSALALFSNPEYVQNTPITGGAEGWLRTRGFNPDEQASKGVLGAKLPPVQKLYFILRDSHLLMFQGGDMLTKPRGVMFLLGTVVEPVKGEADTDFAFRVKSHQCGDQIDLICSSNKIRNRWMDALRVGSRVTYPDFRMLLKEHEILASVTMTPRAAPPSKPNEPSKTALPPVPMLHEDFDIQGELLDPGTQQAFDQSGTPLLRTPEGKLVNVEGQTVLPVDARFNAQGQQLDPFNRPLPPGAVPMFTKEGKPIGVGPDGAHYLPDGSVVKHEEPHFDATGQTLDHETVKAADAVATNINVAIKVRTALKGTDAPEETVDVLGRTYRDEGKSGEGKLVNADGEVVPLASARKIQSSTGQLVHYQEAKPAAPQKSSIRVMTNDDNGDERLLMDVEINDKTTLRELRQTIAGDISIHLQDFTFIVSGVPLLKYEEGNKFAQALEGEVWVRGKELKTVKVTPQQKKVVERITTEEKVAKEQEEFADIMARVRQGKFLRSVKASME